MSQHVVQKPLPSGGGLLVSGTLIDTSAWDASRIRLLVAQRYLRPATADDLTSVDQPRSAPVSNAPTQRQKGRAVHASANHER